MAKNKILAENIKKYRKEKTDCRAAFRFPAMTADLNMSHSGEGGAEHVSPFGLFKLFKACKRF